MEINDYAIKEAIIILLFDILSSVSILHLSIFLIQTSCSNLLRNDVSIMLEVLILKTFVLFSLSLHFVSAK